MAWCSALALLAAAGGFAWRLAPGAAADRRIFLAVNRAPVPWLIDAVLQAVRPLGSGPVLLAAVAAGAAWRPRLGVSLGLAGLMLTLAERLLKLALRRPRPFQSLAEAQVRLWPVPVDPSFPSGDAARAVFLLTTGWGFGAAGAALAALAGVAALVCLGRVRLGVHYPSDVWAGAWLGLAVGLAWSAALPHLPA